MAEQPHGPRRRLREAEQQPHERRLAGTVPSEEAERAAARHLQVDRLQRGARAEALAEAVGLDGERCHGQDARRETRPAASAARPICTPGLIRKDQPNVNA